MLAGKSILSTFTAKLLVSLLGLVLVILVSRNLGAYGRGQIGLFMSGIALLQLFCDFGNSSVLINLSYTHSKRNLWLSSFVWVLLICLLSYPVLFYFSEIRFVFLIPPAAFLYSLINLNQMLLMGSRRVHKRNFSLLVMPAIILPFFIFFATYADMGLQSYPIALFIALSVSFVLSYAFIADLLKEKSQNYVFEKDVLKLGVWVQSAQAVQFLNYRLNFFLVAFFIGNAALGVFNNAVILSESIWILGHSIGQILHLKILNTENEKEQFQTSLKMLVYNFGASVCMSIALICIPNQFWIQLFSSDFSEMSALFPYLIPGVLCFSISNIINHYLHAKREFKKILAANISGLISGLLLAIVLIPGMELKGACISWSGGLAVSMLVYTLFFTSLGKKLP